jgi:predicted ATPase
LRITHLELKNWRNFKHVDVDVRKRLVIVGPNASGKSNLLDAVRFLRDLSQPGGGFQEAVQRRGGLARVRNLAARNFNHGHVLIRVQLGDDEQPNQWEYEVAFRGEPRGLHRPVVTQERISHLGRLILNRPDDDDQGDVDRLTQTALEQVNANRDFRAVADFLASVRYMHLVPQMIREPARASNGGEDPFGGDFLARIRRTPDATRSKRLARIGRLLQAVIPQLDELDHVTDDEGRSHLEARYQHWRGHGARQDERDFSDGTLRLIGLLWALLETGRAAGPLLLEEPELSLHSEVVANLPTLLARAGGRAGQVLLSSHSREILQDPGLGLDEVLLLTPGTEGTVARLLCDDDDVVQRISDLGMNLDEVVLPMSAPADIAQLSLIET